MKTLSSAKKRFSVSAGGKVKYKKVGKRHNLGHRKEASRKLHLRKGAYVHESNVHHVRDMMPYAF